MFFSNKKLNGAEGDNLILILPEISIKYFSVIDGDDSTLMRDKKFLTSSIQHSRVLQREISLFSYLFVLTLATSKQHFSI